MFSPSPHSGWKTRDVDDLIGPLWGEKDEAKRIAGWKKVDRYIADHAYVLPLYQQVQPVVHKAELKFTPHVANYILPATMSRKA
jgi:peptide/nickel transport system substrate-binding protein